MSALATAFPLTYLLLTRASAAGAEPSRSTIIPSRSTRGGRVGARNDADTS
jgi:hypothetical protein